jgi:hypothetical protein
MNIVLMTQYFDTIKDIGSNSNNNTILLPHSPGGMNDLMSQIRNTIISAEQIKGSQKTKNTSSSNKGHGDNIESNEYEEDENLEINDEKEDLEIYNETVKSSENPWM